MPNPSQTRIQNQEYGIQGKTVSSFLYSKFRILYSKSKGFTLIELMVAISIVAILATIGIVAFGATQKSARDAKRKGDLEDIKKAFYLYRASNGSFCPASQAATCGWAEFVDSARYGFNCTTCTAGDNSLKNTLGPNMKGVPSDPNPSTTQPNYYVYVPTPDTFELYAKLEGVATTPYTFMGKGFNYKVTE